MIYLREFDFVSYNNDWDKTTGQDYYNTIYPYHVLSKNRIEKIFFDNITIFYGGNGCGKTTALNVIAEKLRLNRTTLYNKSTFFDDYLSNCHYSSREIPIKSCIVTSDDVFEFTMNLRHINQGLDSRRRDLIEEYTQNYSRGKLSTMSDYDNFSKSFRPKKINMTNFIRQNMHDNVREHSNGESAFLYFTDKIQENALYLLDEPENSLSPDKQQELLKFIEESVRFFKCQFIIATHSPFLLSMQDAKIYDFDANPVAIKKWTELKNVRDYYNFFKLHENEFIERK